MDGYSTFYLVALLFTCGVALLSRQRPRIIGAGYMSVSWLSVMAAVLWAGDIAPSVMFAVIDAVALSAFMILWVFYQRLWALWASAFHVAMLFAHLGAQLPESGIYPTSPFLYLSILSTLGLACMVVITWTPVMNWMRRKGCEDTDYITALPIRNHLVRAWARGFKKGAEA